MDIKEIKEILLSEKSEIPINTSANLGKFITLIPTAFLSAITKTPKFNISKEMTNKILEEGLYHCTLNEEISKNIVSSEHIKASKRTVSYDINEWAFFFAGPPDFASFMKNMYEFSNNANPLTHPDMVVDAIKFMPKEEDLRNYKCRAINDDAIMYQGTCILPHQKIKAVKLVPDLSRNEEGIPIKSDNVEYSIIFRESKVDDFIPGTNIYIPKQDYLDFVNEKAKESGYIQHFSKKDASNLKQKISEALNKGNSIADVGLIELFSTVDSTRKNYKDVLGDIKNRFKTMFSKKIPPSIDQIFDEYKLDKKNPFRDRKFAKKIAELQKEGIVQEDLKTLLSNFSGSKAGAFFSKKYKDIESNIQKNGIHGKEHTDRVSLLAMMIAEKEGLFNNKEEMRYMDILSTASMYHDIGRKLDFGPHALSGANKVKKMELEYINGRKYSDIDKRMITALIEGHTGKPEKINSLIKKYQITDLHAQDMLTKLNLVLRDADALDRARIDVNGMTYYKANLNPDFLKSNSAKAMIMAAYQLENTRKIIGNIQPIIDYNLDENMVEEIKNMNNKDENRFREGILAKNIKDLSSLCDNNIDDKGKDDLSEER